MNTNPTSAIVPICVDDIPLLLTQMMQMGIAEKLDANPNSRILGFELPNHK
jgi:hypothetical protein